MLGRGLSPKDVSRSVLLVVSILILLGSIGITEASVYYSLVEESQTVVGSPPVVLQNGTAGTSTIYTNNTSAKVNVEALNWLSGWNKRIKITVNSSEIDKTLEDFPVLVYLSNSSSGENDEDVSFIFDELQSDNNRKKIAVTTSDGTTQCYVEIERWDDTSEQAWLWVKAPSISNSTDTDLYLYCDSNHADNTIYVGDIASTPAQNVWSNSFSGVWHLNGDFQDSTSNNHNGTNVGSLDAAGMMARGREFNPDDGEDHLEFGDWNVTGNKITLQAWVKCDDFGQDDPRFLTKALSSSADEHVFMLGLSGSGERYLRARIRTGTTTTTLIAGTGGDLTANTWYLVAVTYDGDDSPNNIKLFRNGVEPTSYSSGSQSRTGALVQNAWPIWAGDNPNTPGYGGADGQLDEIRISNVSRSAAWIRANYESERDDLLDYESEERSITDLVDNNTSDIGSPTDKGTHSNFTAQQYGPDLICDALTEEETASGSGFMVQQRDFLFQGIEAYIPLDHEVDITHAFVIMPNLMWQENVTAATSGDPALNADDAFVTAYLYNSTHIRVQRWTSSDGDLRIGWQVLECFDKEFMVQRGEKYLSSFTGQSTTDTIPNPVDPAKSMAWHYWRTSYTGGDGRVSQFYSNVTASTTVAFSRQGTTSVTGYLRWVVAEWDTSKVDHFAQGYITGYGSDTSPFIDGIGTTVNESQSMLIFQTHAIGDDGLDTSTTAGYFSNDTHLAFYNYDSSYNRGVKWYVIDFGSEVGSRQDTDHIAWGSSDYINDDILDPAVQMNRTLVWLSGSCNGDGTAKPRHTQWWVLVSTNSTHANSLHYERRYGDQNREIAWEALELPHSPPNYELDLEVQWTNVNYDESYEELCIYGGVMGEENIMVDVWNGSNWENVFIDLKSEWNNVSVSSYLTSSNFTIRFKGGNEASDTFHNSWDIDVTRLYVWTSFETTYDYVLRVNNTVTDSWEIRLKKYTDSNTNRLQNFTIYFHNSTDGSSSQIVIENGAFVNETGAWYDLGSLETMYIAMTVEANSTGTSYVYTYLEIRIPGTTTYMQYIITFGIT